jgi:hypothetical protein
MNKKNTITLSIFGIIAVIIIILAFLLPNFKSGDTAGTIIKADKYRNEQLSEKDIKLRSEFVKDTAVLAKTIRELFSFIIFSKETAANIDTWWIPQLKKYYSTTYSYTNMSLLQDYVELLKNGNNTLQTTIDMLIDFYNNHNTDKTIDVEGKLASFANFVQQMIVRDSIFESIMDDIDKNIKNDPMMKNRKGAISQLAQIRDRILMDDIQYSVAVGDVTKLQKVANKSFYDLGLSFTGYDYIANLELGIYNQIQLSDFVVDNSQKIQAGSSIQAGDNIKSYGSQPTGSYVYIGSNYMGVNSMSGFTQIPVSSNIYLQQYMAQPSYQGWVMGCGANYYSQAIASNSTVFNSMAFMAYAQSSIAGHGAPVCVTNVLSSIIVGSHGDNVSSNGNIPIIEAGNVIKSYAASSIPLGICANHQIASMSGLQGAQMGIPIIAN